MQRTALALLTLICTSLLQAQTKIFKEVGEDISTQVRPIVQDNVLVIGAIKFRQENLQLEAVAIEQNVLCLG